MVGIQNRVGPKCISPKGTKYNSPGQGQASVARQAAAQGLVCIQMVGRARSFASNRHSTEAEIKPRPDFVLGRAPLSGSVNCSDDGDFKFLTQGSRPGLLYFAPSGQCCVTRYLLTPRYS